MTDRYQVMLKDQHSSRLGEPPDNQLLNMFGFSPLEVVISLILFTNIHIIHDVLNNFNQILLNVKIFFMKPSTL
jgi:hypothetical protein